jgi:hypothetical protein
MNIGKAREMDEVLEECVTAAVVRGGTKPSNRNYTIAAGKAVE